MFYVNIFRNTKMLHVKLMSTYYIIMTKEVSLRNMIYSLHKYIQVHVFIAE